jgi:hypothetical protein
MDMICLMHEGDRRGYLQHATGKPVSPEQIARMTGCSADEVSRLLQELCDSGVYSCTTSGVIFSRRIVRDERKRQLCVEAGKKGGNPTLKGQSKGAPKGAAKGEPTPSSSASSSITQIPAGAAIEARAAPEQVRAAPAKPPAAKKSKRTRTDEEHRIWQAFRREFCEQIWPRYFEGVAYDFDSEQRPQRRAINYEALWRFLDHDAIAWDIEKARKTADYFAQFCADHHPCWDVPLQRLARKADQYWQKSLLPRSNRVIGNHNIVNSARPGEFATDLPIFGRGTEDEGHGIAAAG